MKKILVILFTVFCLCACDQYITRNFGGESTIRLDPGYKLMEATWKESDLWYLVEPMDSNYVPKTKIFIESSTTGIMEGKVIFVESR